MTLHKRDFLLGLGAAGAGLTTPLAAAMAQDYPKGKDLGAPPPEKRKEVPHRKVTTKNLFKVPTGYPNGVAVVPEGVWVAEQKVRAVGADNMAWDCMTERDPDTNMVLFGHAHLLVTHGIHIIENLNLEELAAAGQREFCFIAIPLKFRGATGSPVRPIALVE